jgi:hypothetical protein
VTAYMRALAIHSVMGTRQAAGRVYAALLSSALRRVT